MEQGKVFPCRQIRGLFYHRTGRYSKGFITRLYEWRGRPGVFEIKAVSGGSRKELLFENANPLRVDSNQPFGNHAGGKERCALQWKAVVVFTGNKEYEKDGTGTRQPF